MAKARRQPKPVLISPQAKQDIVSILSYLKENWNQKTIDDFLNKLEAFYQLISLHPRLFSYYNKRKNIRKYALSKQQVIFYRNRRSSIEIITVFDSRQNPSKIKNII